MKPHATRNLDATRPPAGAGPPAPGRVPPAAAGNAQLYRLGRRLAGRIDRHAARGVGPEAALRRAAADLGLDAGTARPAVRFKAAVDLVVGNAGPVAGRLILGGHPRLPPRRVGQLARTHADRQRYEIDQVARGRPLFAKPLPGVEPPFDTLDFKEVNDRLRRSAGLLGRVAAGLAATPPGDWPAIDRLQAIGSRNAATREAGSALRAVVEAHRARVGLEKVPAARRRNRPTAEPAPFRPGRAFTSVSNVRGVMGKNLRDMPRLLREAPPTAQECASVLAGLLRLDAAAATVSKVIRGHVAAEKTQALRGRPEARPNAAAAGAAGAVRVVDAPDGPADWPGTYIVVLRLDADVAVTVRSGRTFPLPAGFHLYVGSQFGAGGVRARTGRHRTPVKAKDRWNVDYLTPHARAVEVWWTHDPTKRECTWSAVLASSPGFGCPAPGFGSNDCRSIRPAGFGRPDGRLCKAHLHHSLTPPDVHAFARRLGRLVPGHAVLYHQTLAAADEAAANNPPRAAAGSPGSRRPSTPGVPPRPSPAPEAERP